MGSKYTVIESVAKSLVAAIPYLGGTINSLIGDYQAGRKFERLQMFYEEIQTDLLKFRSKINDNYISNDDFLDIFEETAKLIVNERTKEKRIAYKNIILNSIISNEVDYDYTEENLRILARLRFEHIYFLALFNNPRKVNTERGSPINEGGGISTTLYQLMTTLMPEVNEEIVLDICQDLENERLLRNFVSNYKTMMTDQGIRHLQNKLTNKGEKFYNYITIPEE